MPILCIRFLSTDSTNTWISHKGHDYDNEEFVTLNESFSPMKFYRGFSNDTHENQVCTNGKLLSFCGNLNNWPFSIAQLPWTQVFYMRSPSVPSAKWADEEFGLYLTPVACQSCVVHELPIGKNQHAVLRKITFFLHSFWIDRLFERHHLIVVFEQNFVHIHFISLKTPSLVRKIWLPQLNSIFHFLDIIQINQKIYQRSTGCFLLILLLDLAINFNWQK